MNAPVEQFYAQWKSSLDKLRASAPEVARAFGGLHVAMMKPGSLSMREKELIALSIGIAQGCTDCIFLHVESALKEGANRAQVLEAAGVAVMMAGGPGFVHLPAVMEALDHLKA